MLKPSGVITHFSMLHFPVPTTAYLCFPLVRPEPLLYNLSKPSSVFTYFSTLHFPVSTTPMMPNMGFSVGADQYQEFSTKIQSSSNCDITFTWLVGEQSEPSLGWWMENFVLLCMPICGIYICVICS